MKNYDAKKVIQVFNNIPILGYADGTFVSVERNEDSFELTVGSDSEGCRSQVNNFSGRVTFTLGQWSATNDLLSALLTVDELTGNGIGPYILKDLKGTTLVTAESAWIVKPANIEYDRSPTSREWIIESDRLIMAVGGNI